MRTYLYAAALLALASCAPPNQAPPPQSEPIGADAVPRDSTHALAPAPTTLPTIVVEPHRSLLDKVLGRTPAPVTYTGGRAIKAGKKSNITINNVTGGQTNTTNTAGKNAAAGAGATGGKADGPMAGTGAVASVTGKKSGPAVVASDSSTLNTVAGGGNLAAVTGDGNTTAQTKQDTTKEAPGPLAVLTDNLTGPLGYVLAAVAVGGIILLIIRRRARKAAENLV